MVKLLNLTHTTRINEFRAAEPLLAVPFQLLSVAKFVVIERLCLTHKRLIYTEITGSKAGAFEAAAPIFVVFGPGATRP